MLKEKIAFPENLPINIYIASIEEYPIHYHDELEVIFVLEGTVKVKDGYYTYVLKKEDVLIINDRELHSINNTSEDNIVLIFQIDLQFFGQYHSHLANSFFVTDTSYNMDVSNEPLDKLRRLMARIMVEATNKVDGYRNRIIDYTNEFITGLIDNFQYFAMDDGKFINEMKHKGNKILAERVHRITDYIYENYYRKLTLKEIAEKEHLSVYYLSHVIKEAAGLSFQDFLNFVRVEESEKLLLGTDKKLSDIALECGFSATRYYVKYFEKWFGCNPQDYRNMYSEKVKDIQTSARFVPFTPESTLGIIKTHFRNEYNHLKESKKIVHIIEIDGADGGRAPSKNELKTYDTLKIHNIHPFLFYENHNRLKEICSSLKISNIKISGLNEFSDIEAVVNLLGIGIRIIIEMDYKGYEQIMKEIQQIEIKLKARNVIDSEKKLGFEIGISPLNEVYIKNIIHKIKEEIDYDVNFRIKKNTIEENQKHNYIYDTILMVPYIINIGFSDQVKINEDIYLDSGDYSILKGDKGVVTVTGIKKPSYYAYKMLATLKDGNIIYRDNGCMVCKHRETIRIIFFDSEKYLSDGYLNLRSPEELLSIIENTFLEKEIILKIKGMKGRYLIKRYKISKQNCIFAMYAKLGLPEILTKEEEDLLHWASYPNVYIREIEADDVIDIHGNITEFSAELIILEKIK